MAVLEGLLASRHRVDKLAAAFLELRMHLMALATPPARWGTIRTHVHDMLSQRLLRQKSRSLLLSAFCASSRDVVPNA